jgi:hypothetical protein
VPWNRLVRNFLTYIFYREDKIMGKLHIHNTKKILLALIAMLFLGFFPAGDSSTASGCVTCHTKEDMIIKNLAKKEKVKSALQSGAG